MAGSYDAYLQSAHWRAIREWALERSDGRCERCGSRAEDVHHRSYERVGCELPEDLEALCRSCHQDEHQAPEDHSWERRLWDDPEQHKIDFGRGYSEWIVDGEIVRVPTARRRTEWEWLTQHHF